MSKRQLLIILGVWMMLFLFLGFPSSWDKVFALISGIIIVVISITLKPPQRIVHKDSVPFVEHKSTTPPHIADSTVSANTNIDSTSSVS
jgi:hypothetical protein